MTFEETTQFLFNQLPVFQDKGASAYKPGLNNTLELDKYFNFPHKNYRTIHIAGTNGKGSTSHSIAAILQSAGYKVGLYTSPHLVDFRERIRVNGKMISKQYVIDFVENNFKNIEYIHPSFFELSMMMAFCYFKDMNVDVAIIEVGLGGRLDSTNIISPDLSIITNISKDHTQFLGDTLDKIAKEKAGIIKDNIPVIIGESGNQIVRNIFEETASSHNSKILFAENCYKDLSQDYKNGEMIYNCSNYPNIISQLEGDYHINNMRTILTSIDQLKLLGYNINTDSIYNGIANVISLTGLQGRWQKISTNPQIYCDTGHNVGGIVYISNKLKTIKCKNLHIIIGMVNDKDITEVMSLLPDNAIYYFTQASVNRALPSKDLQEIASRFNLKGDIYKDRKSVV